MSFSSIQLLLSQQIFHHSSFHLAYTREGIPCINPAPISGKEGEISLTFMWKEFFSLTRLLFKVKTHHLLHQV